MAEFNLKGMQDGAIFQLENMNWPMRLDDDWREFRDEVRKVCDLFLTLSTASLYIDVKPPMFFANLYRSANNWMRFLGTSQNHYQHQPLLTYNAPLMAAIITGDMPLLTRISAVLPQVPTPKLEYEDNFHLCWLLLLLAINKCELSEEIEAKLSAYKRVTEDTTKLEMFHALLGLDDLTMNDFWPLFESALFDYQENVAEKTKTFTTSPPKFIAHKYLWLEGLAFLHLALHKGARPPFNDIEFCPEDALQKMPDNFYAEDWLVVPFIK